MFDGSVKDTDFFWYWNGLFVKILV